MILLRVCALFALLLPASTLASIATKGGNEFVLAMIVPLGFIALQVAAISTLVFAAKRRSDAPHAWPTRWNTIAAAVCVVFPWLAEAFGVPFKPGILILMSALEIYVAIQLLIAPGSEAYVAMRRSGQLSAADVVRRHALGRTQNAEGPSR